MSDLYRPTDRFKGEVKRLVVQGALVKVEPVGYVERYSPRESTDGASVESIRWFGAKKPGRFTIVKIEGVDDE